VDRHRGDSAVILGSAPTLKLATSHSASLGIFVGDSMLRTKLRPPVRYFVRANSEYPNLTRATHISDLMNLEATWIIAETVMESRVPVRDLIQQVIPESKEGFVFDQRHFGGSACSVPGDCCRILESSVTRELTLQELIASYSESENCYSSGSTVALHALALAVIMGCIEIHIAGVEIPRDSRGYIYSPTEESCGASLRRKIDDTLFKFKKFFSENQFRDIAYIVFKRITSRIKAHFDSASPSIFSPDFDQIISDFSSIVMMANKVGAKVFVCSHTSALLEIEGVIRCPLTPRGSEEDQVA